MRGFFAAAILASVVLEADAVWPSAQAGERYASGFSDVYEAQCGVCHGERMEGTGQGPPLVGNRLTHGESAQDIERSIARGAPENGMPAWGAVLAPVQIQSLAILIAERRAGFSYQDFRFNDPIAVPEGLIQTEEESFRVETLAEGLDPHPYSIAPLPDGRVLLTEKFRGLIVISPDGERSQLVPGAPRGYDDATQANDLGIRVGVGSVLDVALHPDYARNGWVYLYLGDRCDACNALSKELRQPVSMAKIVRGRIRNGGWEDEATIWQADVVTYTAMTDGTLGGRIAFDAVGHLFFSVGMKGMQEHAGIQDLGSPYGKTFRVNDDGTVPSDNPYVGVEGALPSIWTYGHRVSQGLEVSPLTGELWGTEMGPRGGDEINLLLPGRNYGWPLHSGGVNYDGTPVDWSKTLGITFEREDLEEPVLDLTPSPALSSFVFYRGDSFPKWRDDLIVGSLKAKTLYRVVVDGKRVTHRETLLEGIARIRDVEIDSRGDILLLLEHAAGGKIVRLIRVASGNRSTSGSDPDVENSERATLPRVPYATLGQLPEALRERVGALPPLNIVRMFVLAPTNADPLLSLAASILEQQKLDPRLRELAILRVAHLTGASYEWAQHVPIAKAAGVTDAEVAAVARDIDDGSRFGEVETRLLRFTDEVTRDVKASELTFRALAAHLDSRELMELTLAIGFYGMVARVMETFEVPIEPAAQRPIGPSKPN